jgi:hypothetical protein
MDLEHLAVFGVIRVTDKYEVRDLSGLWKQERDPKWRSELALVP